MNTDRIASTHLGKKSAGSEVYNPSLLVAVPREENRKQYGISNSGKLKVESGKFIVKDIEGASFPSGEGVRRTEGVNTDKKIEGKLFNDNNFSEILQEQQIDNSLSSYPPTLQPSENNFSTLQPFNLSTNMPPHPNPLPQGEGACHDNLSTNPVSAGRVDAILPFWGYDIWHAYEFSCMTENGIPITRVMKMKYPCDNEFLVESKSLKLYLNSFNMMKFGKNTQECLKICKNMIEKDLSELLKTTVEINFLDKTVEQVRIFEDFENIMNFVDENEIQIIDFKENPEILQVEEAEEREYKLTFDSLRSNCRVTHQPDFGDAFIYYKSKKHIKEDSLVKYLTSFRSEYHFHEECCEMIFKRLSDILDEKDELMVCALYTRRGGIDICPVRWSGKLKVESGKLNAPYILSDFSQQPQTDMDLSPYRPIALSPYANDIKALLNIQIFARNGIKQ